METDHSVDRSGWEPGPWDDEGDREQWTTTAGLPGLITRNRYGEWCGYAAVAPGHPYYQCDYDAVDVDVHGGLNYADACRAHICHTPEPGQSDDVWWFGFDCGHYMDLSPGRDLGLSPEDFGMPPLVYRTAGYARAEVERLATQLADAHHG